MSTHTAAELSLPSYFRDRTPTALRKSKTLERAVDNECARIIMAWLQDPLHFD